MQRTAARLGRGSYWPCLLVAIALGQGHRQQLCFQSGFTRMGVVLVDAAYGISCEITVLATRQKGCDCMVGKARVLPNEMCLYYCAIRLVMAVRASFDPKHEYAEA